MERNIRYLSEGMPSVLLSPCCTSHPLLCRLSLSRLFDFFWQNATKVKAGRTAGCLLKNQSSVRSHLTFCVIFDTVYNLDWSHLALALPSKHVIEGKIEGRKEVTGRRARRGKQLLDDFKGKKGCWRSIWKSLWTCCKRGCGMMM
jgi:hypothetical protein